MAWQQWFYLVVIVLAVAYSATQVGKPRKPYSGRDLAGQIISGALFVALVLSI